MAKESMEALVSFAKRRGFIFPGSDIYGGMAAIYDFGPYGVHLANNIKDAWWKSMVQENENIVGLDSSIFTHPKVWEVSGHVGGFSDPLTECKKCNSRLRVDHLLEEIGVFADEKMSEEEINELFDKHTKKITCPKCGQKEFTEAKHFNLLVQSNLGNFSGDWGKDPVYLRGETAQGIYINYKNVVDTARVKIPFGIAQIGKAFRNEITARQFIFRKREFEQMEMQMFVSPGDVKKVYKDWKERRMQFYLDIGLKKKNLKFHKHENLVFYAKEAYDIEYNYPFGFKELEGIHARGDYDLSQHIKHSGVDMKYKDPKTGESFVPNVVETSAGLERTFLAVLADAYTEEKLKDGSERVVLKISHKLAPIKVAIFPLLKNKEKLVGKAKEVYEMLKKDFMCEFDDNGNVGKRYRRQDEIGTPFCVTVDFDSLEDKCVTVRDRDTMAQERISIEELPTYLQTKLK